MSNPTSLLMDAIRETLQATYPEIPKSRMLRVRQAGLKSFKNLTAPYIVILLPELTPDADWSAIGTTYYSPEIEVFYIVGHTENEDQAAALEELGYPLYQAVRRGVGTQFALPLEADLPDCTENNLLNSLFLKANLPFVCVSVKFKVLFGVSHRP